MFNAVMQHFPLIKDPNEQYITTMGINHTSNTKTVIILYASDLLLTII